MPGRSGVDVLQDIKKLAPELPVLVLSMYPESQFATRVLAAGAHGYLSKGSDRDEFIKAIRTVLGGGGTSVPWSRTCWRAGWAGGPARCRTSCCPTASTLSWGHRGGQDRHRDRPGPLGQRQDRQHYRKRVLEKLKLRTNSDLTRHALEHKLL